MNRRRLFCVLLGLAGSALWLGAHQAGAAPLLIESLDWVVADADLVVRGTLTDFDRVRDKEETIWSTATLKVAETWRGEKKDEIKFVASHRSRFASDRLAAFAKDQTEIVVCLVKSERYKAKGADYAGQPWALRLMVGELDHTVVDLSEKPGTFAVALDGRILTKKDDLLKTIAAAAAGKTPAQGRLRAPISSEVVRKLSDGNVVWLLVPLTERLETTARDWLKAKDLDLRLDGLKALRAFKSEENTRLLKDLLTDAMSKAEGKVKTYPVRQAAFDVLKQWGVEVPRPVTEEPAGK